MKNCISQTLLLLLGLLCLQSCDDSTDATDLSKANAAAAVIPSKVSFKMGDKQPVTLNLSVAVSEKAGETVRFELQVADNSEVTAEKVNFTQNQLVIQKGKRSQETTFTVEADAVDKGTKDLIVDLISSNAKVPNQQLTIPVTMKLNTIKHFFDLNQLVDFGENTWQSVMLGDDQIAGLFQTSVAIGSAPAVKRIHFDNYGEDVIGVADGDLINLTPLAEGSIIGASSKWVKNPYPIWEYMPVLYSEAYTEWLGQTAYAGMKIQGYNFWFKFTVTENAEFTLTEFAYDEDGNDIKAGQIDSTK